MKKLTIEHNWSLNEGRTTELEFSFVEEVNENEYVNVSPHSTCKDYLNDQVHAEIKQKTAPEIYGFEAEPLGIFKEKKPMVVFNMRNNTNDEIKKLFEKNIDNLIYFVHSVEDYLGISEKSEFEPINVINSKGCNSDKVLKGYIVTFSNDWVQKTYLISCFAYLIRMGFELNSKISIKNIKKQHLRDSNKKLLLPNTLMKIDIIKDLLKTYSFKDLIDENYTGGSDIHNRGFGRSTDKKPYCLSLEEQNEKLKFYKQKVEGEVQNKKKILENERKSTIQRTSNAYFKI